MLVKEEMKNPPSTSGVDDVALTGPSSHEQTVSIQPLESHIIAGTTLVSAEVKKTITPMTMLALCFNICSSWAGFSTSIQIALLQGGAMTLIYGMMLTATIYLCIATLLADLASVYPTAGGQYHFTSILAPACINRASSYICGFITTFYWIATNAAVSIITALQIAALATWYNPNMSGHAWQVFLIFQAVALLATLCNIFWLKLLHIAHNVGFALSVALLLTSFVGLLTRARPKASDAFVWSTFTNSTGWPSEICFLTGMLTPFFMFGGLDGSCILPKRPIGFLTACPYAIAILYSITDFGALLNNDGWIPFEISRQEFRSDEAALVLLFAERHLPRKGKKDNKDIKMTHFGPEPVGKGI